MGLGALSEVKAHEGRVVVGGPWAGFDIDVSVMIELRRIRLDWTSCRCLFGFRVLGTCCRLNTGDCYFRNCRNGRATDDRPGCRFESRFRWLRRLATWVYLNRRLPVRASLLLLDESSVSLVGC